ncbi:hypothetical protein [Thalassococcus lentus]|uniref:DUF1772 domain-containing protein n=1 Tax=Thalassococcus lentus TaxID=1210524 RepID=A0ABT4XPX7_9RHOB|nr:hypothetical protein [Thalassococcus lentus]MDA7424004.1 hypothetical protein [Thalassococcus lentus]
MAKPVQFVLLLGLACLVSAVFGALHNQLSYSVGAGYFYEFKFPQFGVTEDLQNRLGAALVGVRASWWMGLMLGVPVFGLACVLLPSSRVMPVGVAAIVIAMICTLIGAMIGLVLGLYAPQVADQLPLPSGISDEGSFLRAALMHEGAYFGAGFGLLAGLWVVWGARKPASA